MRAGSQLRLLVWNAVMVHLRASSTLARQPRKLTVQRGAQDTRSASSAPVLLPRCRFAGDLTPSNVLLTSATKDARRFTCKVGLNGGCTLYKRIFDKSYSAVVACDHNGLVRFWNKRSKSVSHYRSATLGWQSTPAACPSGVAATLAQVRGEGGGGGA